MQAVSVPAADQMMGLMKTAILVDIVQRGLGYWGSMDYKDFKEGKYPEPGKRLTSKDFPSLDELFVYGEDIPIPESMEELRCRYNEDDRFPLVLTDLEGYKAPPLGLSAVWTNGGGGKKGFVYPPGTFREDKFTMNKELGANTEQVLAIREDKRTERMVDGIRQSFEEHGITLDGRSKTEVLGAMAKVAMDKVFDDKSAREARMFAETMYKILGTKEENKERREKKPTYTLDEAREWLEFTKEAREQLLREDVMELKFVEDDELKD
jgi:hypothetical protein